jgi:ATP-binding cassette subfamily C (CFTR/MRP) protein 1
MSGLARKLASSIQQMRIDEIQAALPFRLISVFSATLAQFPIAFSPVAAFAVFTIVALRTGETLEAARMFSSLSLILLLAAPLFMTFQVILMLQSSLACFDRIQKFLSSVPRVDSRIRHPMTRQPSNTHTPRRIEYHKQIGSSVGLAAIPPSVQPNKQVSENAVDIQLQDTSFAWSADAQPVVRKINLTVNKGQLLMLVGPVASGKSTLLKGLLGEVPVTIGSVGVAQASMSWCDQTPWIKVNSQ